MTTSATSARKGGAWLIEDTPPGDVLTPARLTDEHRMIGQTAVDFVTNEVLTVLDRLEQKDWALARDLVRQCGELGLIATDVPERFGGLDLDKTAAVVVAEGLGRSASFATTFGGQTGLAIMPLLLYGTEAQKAKYLPGLASGELVGAYALSESGSGSDALSVRTRATRQPDGSYRLDGEKMWITNGGFADVIIVFAKIDGEHFSAFIVERGFAGVSSGKEEHKMGLHGSSTTPIILQNAEVPADNLLGEAGKGHKVAFNVLNYGRFKLAAMCSGGAKAVIGEACRYASERRQFGRPIASFGAIRHKIGEMVAQEYAIESMLFRTVGLIDAALHGAPDGAASHEGEPLRAALEEYAVESSILKVAASESIDFILDENIQIHGGNGFVKDYPAERHYRDARVNRIFEGTNEINRLLIPGLLARRALKGSLPIIPAARRLQEELLAPAAAPAGDGPFAAEERALAAMKKVALMVLGTAMQTLGARLADEQEVLCYAADILIDTFAAESSLLRAAQTGDPLAGDATRVVVNDALGRVETAARQALAALADGDTLRTLMAALRRLVKITPANTVALRRRLSDAALEKKGYPMEK